MRHKLIAVSLGLTGVLATAPNAGSQESSAPTCGGRVATIVGTPDADTLVGTSGDDVIVGAGGRDSIRGLAGDDFLCAGRSGEWGDRSLIQGGLGRDHITGARLLIGGPGRDTIRVLEGGFAFVRPGGGDDHINAAGAALEFPGARRGVVVDLERRRAWGQGEDRLRGSFGWISGSDFDDRLLGDDSDQTFDGEGGDDVLRGRGGRDRFVGGEGHDVAFGGTGADLCYLSVEERNSCILWDD